MKKYINYKSKLFIYFFILFAIFTASILSFQYQREKEFKIEQLESSLDIYVQTVNKFIKVNSLASSDSKKFKNLILQLPSDALRITLIRKDGKVLFDNDVENTHSMENHLSRPEIIRALHKSYGTATRYSKSVSKDYYYYAKYFGDYYVRASLPYDIEVQNLLKADNLFIYFLVLAFILIVFSLLYISDKLGKSISSLKDFAIHADNETYDETKAFNFPNNELGIISKRIINIYERLRATKEELDQEREKLFMHFHHSEHGIAIFSPIKEKIFANSKFVQHINTILETPVMELSKIFEAKEFTELTRFIEAQQNEKVLPVELPRFISTIYKNSKYFTIKSIVFQDNSFEISIVDITNIEKTRILKQEMTSNIAHELRTPVTSVRGFLETIIENKDINNENKNMFIDKSYKQILRLSDLLSDISLITKTEEAADKFNIEEINIKSCIKESLNDLNLLIKSKEIEVNVKISDNIIVKGNKILLSLLYRNLIDNTIHHVGRNAHITIDNYLEDENYYYFSYSDDGEGVPEEHLNRLFERFYRADSGRTRKVGGTGLGLAIVKNSVLFHGGEITVKNKKDKGLEFLFTLKKNN